jgi:hypothetical protein
MFGGSGRKLIAEQAGAALPGALVAASAGKAAKASAKPSATMIVVCIVLPPVAKLSLILRQLTRKEESKVNADGTGSSFSGRVRSTQGD